MIALIEEFKKELTDIAEFAPSTVDNYVACMAAFFNYAAHRAYRLAAPEHPGLDGADPDGVADGPHLGRHLPRRDGKDTLHAGGALCRNGGHDADAVHPAALEGLQVSLDTRSAR